MLRHSESSIQKLQLTVKGISSPCRKIHSGLSKISSWNWQEQIKSIQAVDFVRNSHMYARLYTTSENHHTIKQIGQSSSRSIQDVWSVLVNSASYVGQLLRRQTKLYLIYSIHPNTQGLRRFSMLPLIINKINNK